MKKILSSIVIVAAVFTLAACGGGDSGGTAGLNNANTVTGTVYSASGDPVPGTTVYIPGTSVTAQIVKASRTFAKVVTASDGTECEDPPAADQSLAAGCSAADGTFSIDTSSITTNPTQIVMQRGSLRQIINNFSCTSDPCAIPAESTTFGSSATWPRVAVVTGNWDNMENVLAKLADSDTTDDQNGQYGRVNATSGMFVYGSEYGTNLTIINGTGLTTPEENTGSVTYKNWGDYLLGTEPLISGGAPVFDVVFINCCLTCGGYDQNDLLNNSVRTILQDYVNAGGRLYVTDLSYDFIEQPFPQFMQFEGDPADPNTPGGLDSAETGTGGIWLDAAVNETAMSNWLQGTGVTVNAHDANTPGNPDFDCGIPPYDQHQGALLASGLIPLGDFAGGWAQMVGAHTGYSPTIWISSGAGVNFDGRDNRPLTVTMDSGSNGGKLIYSSYHTAHSCSTPTFWPQERVLQYLIFGAF